MTAAPLLVTLGDPAGIGPEVVVKAWLAGELEDAVIVGHPGVFGRGLQACGLPAGPQAAEVATRPWPVFEADPPPSLPGVDAPAPQDWGVLPWGRQDARCGAEAARRLHQAVQRMRQGRGRAIVTGPIHKEALALAGVPFPGHTEMLQAWASPGQPLPPVRMMLAHDELRVVLVTLHVSLRQAIDALNFDTVLETILITQRALQTAGLQAPRIAVAGLNPHAGEGGLFGREEIDFIAPAIEAARGRGVEASGPYPPDTVFMQARHTAARPGAFDAVVAMTHDHGLIPIKYLGLDQGVNITLGLPFVRTSPDHGTAFDIAGQGRADPSSLVQALRQARRLTQRPSTAV